MQEFQLTTEKFTCLICVHNERIVHTAPLLRKFIGQELSSLLCWIERVANEAQIIALNDNCVVYTYTKPGFAGPPRRSITFHSNFTENLTTG